jgi:hypothetical protein
VIPTWVFFIVKQKHFFCVRAKGKGFLSGVLQGGYWNAALHAHYRWICAVAMPVRARWNGELWWHEGAGKLLLCGL